MCLWRSAGALPLDFPFLQGRERGRADALLGLGVVEDEGGAVRGEDTEVLPRLQNQQICSTRVHVCVCWLRKVDVMASFHIRPQPSTKTHIYNIIYMYMYQHMYNTWGRSPCVMKAKSAWPRCASAAACSARSCF